MKMKNNILILSHVYPGAGVPDAFTPVVHYFVKEWVKIGYNVRVVSIWNYFPFFYYLAPKWVRNFAVKKFGCVLPEKQLPEDTIYELDGVKVYRLTLKKMLPASEVSPIKLDTIAHKIVCALENENFVPDFIVSHWATPQIYISKKLKDVYHSKTALVLHEDGSRIKQFDNWKELVDNIDVWGYRSLAIKNSFEKNYGRQARSFRCCSGIPDFYLKNRPMRTWATRNRYIYVGYLLRRKYADVAVNAVADLYKKENYRFDIIGDGEMKQELAYLLNEKQIESYVHLLGRLPRNEVISHLDDSDIFIMISKNEVFGLVYLEAMARGCIAIASKNEGMEGIIKDGYNGFLCEAGNYDELKRILSKIDNMSSDKLKEISENAIHTAEQYTDVAVAKQYIDNVVNL